VEAQQYLQRLADMDARVARARPDPAVLVERAAGLLAGRVGCRVSEAHSYLTQLASGQHRAPHEVAIEVLAALEGPGTPTAPGRLRAAVDQALAPPHPPAGQAPRDLHPDQANVDWARMMQQVLDLMPDQHTALLPVRDAAGQVTDYVLAAVSPSMVDLSGRGPAQLVGRRIGEVFPTVVAGPVWQAWQDALADGRPRQVGPVPYIGRSDRTPAEMTITVRVQPVGPGLLNSWVRHDEETRLAERIQQTERLGNLGWGEWDVVTGTVTWSDELYRIYERDPADGPLSNEEQQALTLPEDRAARRQAAELFGLGQTVDIAYRIRVGDRVKHVRVVLDAVRDMQGRPLKVYGIVQDVTARETSRARLADVEQRLREHQASLAAEHQLAAQLQQIILPIPTDPIDLPGLRAAVRYLPAEQASRVGGDWFHAAPADDGSVVLAIGDLAGHGLHAATAMAQVRHALAALVVTATTDPAELLTHLNHLLLTIGPATATAVVARYEPASQTLVWAQAGHPAPLHTRAGVTTPLDRPRGLLLGAIPTTYDTATTTLERGDLLVFYTDGLIERRGHSLAEGLAPVIATLNRISRAASDQPLATLLTQLDQANPVDDTCVLAFRPA
jgi:serine phosphatase RsbU (regulator of sigma subunit)